MGDGISWAAIASIVALLTAIAGVYTFGKRSGQQESKIIQLEQGLRALETKVDTSLKEVAERLTRMEDRLFNAMAGMQETIRKDLRSMRGAPKISRRNSEDENA